MADYVGMSRSAWVNATRQKGGAKVNKPPEEAMVRLCERCGLTMDWIYRGVFDRVPYAFALALQVEMGTDPAALDVGAVLLPGLVSAR